MKTNYIETYQRTERYNGSAVGIVGILAAAGVAAVTTTTVNGQTAPALSYEYNYIVGDGCLNDTPYDTSRASVQTTESGEGAELTVTPNEGVDSLRYTFAANAAGRMVLTPEDATTVQLLDNHNC